MGFLIGSLALVPALTAVAVVAGEAAARGRRPWLPLAGIWLGVALAQYFALLDPPSHPLAAALILLAPLGVAALAVEMEVRRGCSLWRAGSVAVVLGVAVAAGLPLLFRSVALVATWATRGTRL